MAEVKSITLKTIKKPQIKDTLTFRAQKYFAYLSLDKNIICI